MQQATIIFGAAQYVEMCARFALWMALCKCCACCVKQMRVRDIRHCGRELTKNEEGVEVERRWVEPDPKKGYHYYDANEIAPEWHQVCG